jgi:hypothetical protein
MGRYYFHVRNGSGEVNLDIEGEEHPDPLSVRAEALEAAQFILGHRLQHDGVYEASRRFEIMDEQGQLVMTVPFSLAVGKRGQDSQAADDREHLRT